MHPAPRTSLLVILLALLFGCDGIIMDPGSSPGGGGSGRGGGGGGTGALDKPDVPVSGPRRLSRAELDNTLRDLLGSDSRLGTTHLPEDNQEREGMFLHWPFDNAYPKQKADRILVLAIETIAQTAAEELIADSVRREALVPCEPTGADDTACLRELVTDFGRLAFRRPLAPEEVDNFMRLAPYAAEAGDFWFGVKIVLQAMLQSPDFLYRVEIGSPAPDADGVHILDDYEIAARMSYLLWGSTPDRWLLDLADAGGLASSDDRREAARRMLEDERAVAQVDRFHALWLGYNQLPHAAELTTAMREETHALLRRVIFDEDLPYMEIFRFPETHVSDSLAAHYGLPEPDGAAGWIPYGDGRGGILSHGSVLSGFSTGGDTSVTRRGVFVRERLMCQLIPPPPPDVNADELPEAHCKSEVVEIHQRGGCGSCHQYMDPIGWGLENYDLAGRFREHDEGKPECAIDGDGEIADIGSFRGPGELGELLVDEGSLEACAIRQVVRFAVGREERAEDQGFIEELVEQHRGAGWTFRELLVDIVASEWFAQVRRDEQLTTTSTGTEG